MKGGQAVGKAGMVGNAINLICIENVQLWQVLISRDCGIISHLRSCHGLRTLPKQECENNTKGKTGEGNL